MSSKSLSQLLNRPLSRRDALRAGSLGIAATASGVVGLDTTYATTDSTENDPEVLKDQR